MGLLTYNHQHPFDQTDWLVQSAQLAQSAGLLRPVPDAMNVRALKKPVDSCVQSNSVYPANTMIPTQFYLPPTDQLHEHAHLTALPTSKSCHRDYSYRSGRALASGACSEMHWCAVQPSKHVNFYMWSTLGPLKG